MNEEKQNKSKAEAATETTPVLPLVSESVTSGEVNALLRKVGRGEITPHLANPEYGWAEVFAGMSSTSSMVGKLLFLTIAMILTTLIVWSLPMVEKANLRIGAVMERIGISLTTYCITNRGKSTMP